METELFNLIAVSSSFLFILLAEIGDKTQLMTITLATRYQSTVQVFFAVLLAEATISTVAIIVGTTISQFIPLDMISRVAGSVFIIYGILSLKKEENKNNNQLKKTETRIFFTIFALVFIAEMGDKTQLAAIALAVEHNAPISVAIGTIAAFATSSIIAVILGKKLSTKLSTGVIQKIAAVTFIAIGITLLLGIF